MVHLNGPRMCLHSIQGPPQVVAECLNVLKMSLKGLAYATFNTVSGSPCEIPGQYLTRTSILI